MHRKRKIIVTNLILSIINCALIVHSGTTEKSQEESFDLFTERTKSSTNYKTFPGDKLFKWRSQQSKAAPSLQGMELEKKKTK